MSGVPVISKSLGGEPPAVRGNDQSSVGSLSPEEIQHIFSNLPSAAPETASKKEEKTVTCLEASPCSIECAEALLLANQPEEAFNVVKGIRSYSPNIDLLLVLITAAAVKAALLELAENAVDAIFPVGEEKIEALALTGRSEEAKTIIEKSRDDERDALKLSLVRGLHKRAKLVPLAQEALLEEEIVIANGIRLQDFKEEAFLLIIQQLVEQGSHVQGAHLLSKFSSDSEKRARACTCLGLSGM